MPSTEIMLADRTRAYVAIDGQHVIVEREGRSKMRLTSHREVLDFAGPKTLRDAVLRAWESVRVGREEIPAEPPPRSVTAAQRQVLERVDRGLPIDLRNAMSARALCTRGFLAGPPWSLTEAGRVELYGVAS